MATTAPGGRLSRTAGRVGLLVLCLVGAPAVGLCSIADRVAGRSFPSVFQAWGEADNMAPEPEDVTLARHDLFWHGPWGVLRLVWDGDPTGLATGFTPESLAQAAQRRQALLGLNPNLILIAEIRYRDAWESFLGGPGHEWWLRDSQGDLVYGWVEGGFIRLDFRNEAFRAHVAQRAAAACQAGCDGVLLDWWSESESFEGEDMLPHRLDLLQRIGAATGEEKLIIVNSNERQVPNSAAYVNGLFMECYDSATVGSWSTIESTLLWAEQNLKEPRVNCLEFWYLNSRDDLNLMRAVTTLSLTHSNGYCLFSDPNPLPTPDHLHNWYNLWEKRLGVPLEAGVWNADGTVSRRFEKGVAVYNGRGKSPAQLVFGQRMLSVATGLTSNQHTLNGEDGDIYLYESVSGDPTASAGGCGAPAMVLLALFSVLIARRRA